MAFIEMIQIRPISLKEQNAAVASFRKLTTPEDGLWPERVLFCKSPGPDYDLCIVIWHPDQGPTGRRSPLGHQLAEAFSEFGRVRHQVWVEQSRLPMCGKRGGRRERE